MQIIKASKDVTAISAYASECAPGNKNKSNTVMTFGQGGGGGSYTGKFSLFPPSLTAIIHLTLLKKAQA